MIHKIAQGESLTMRVTEVVLNVPATNKKYGPSHKFVGLTNDDDDAAVFMTPASAERQLGRCGLSLERVVGQTIVFTRPGEYLDIVLPAGAPVPAPAPAVVAPRAAVAAAGKVGFSSGGHLPGVDDEPTPAPAPSANGDAPIDPAKADQWRRLIGLHRRCLKQVLEHEVPLLDDKKIGSSPESIGALTAQLFIAATSAGLHR